MSCCVCPVTALLHLPHHELKTEMRKITFTPQMSRSEERPLMTPYTWNENFSLSPAEGEWQNVKEIAKRLHPSLGRKKNPYGYLQPNETSPSHTQPPNHHLAVRMTWHPWETSWQVTMIANDQLHHPYP